MKKDRNSFFPNFGASQPNSNFFPNSGMQGMNPGPMSPPMQGMPNPGMQGMPNPGMQGMYNPNMVPEQMYPYGGYGAVDDYDMRMTKIEKMIKRLDARITKIESKSGALIDDDDITTSTNMYMI